MCEAPVTTPFLHKSISVYGWSILIERNQVFPLSAELLGSRSAWLGAGNVGCVCLIMCRRGNTCRGSAYSSAGFIRHMFVHSFIEEKKRDIPFFASSFEWVFRHFYLSLDKDPLSYLGRLCDLTFCWNPLSHCIIGWMKGSYGRLSTTKNGTKRFQRSFRTRCCWMTLFVMQLGVCVLWEAMSPLPAGARSEWGCQQRESGLVKVSLGSFLS